MAAISARPARSLPAAGEASGPLHNHTLHNSSRLTCLCPDPTGEWPGTAAQHALVQRQEADEERGKSMGGELDVVACGRWADDVPDCHASHCCIGAFGLRHTVRSMCQATCCGISCSPTVSPTAPPTSLPTPLLPSTSVPSHPRGSVVISFPGDLSTLGATSQAAIRMQVAHNVESYTGASTVESVDLVDLVSVSFK